MLLSCGNAGVGKILLGEVVLWVSEIKAIIYLTVVFKLYVLVVLTRNCSDLTRSIFDNMAL